jgi:hypothetical protein
MKKEWTEILHLHYYYITGIGKFIFVCISVICMYIELICFDRKIEMT